MSCEQLPGDEREEPEKAAEPKDGGNWAETHSCTVPLPAAGGSKS